MKNVNNYRFQKQQQAKQQHQKVKKIKEKHKKTPVNVTEELDYIKKLLNGEEIEDFGPKEVKLDVSATYWDIEKDLWKKAVNHQVNMISASQMSLSDYLQMMGGKGYYK